MREKPSKKRFFAFLRVTHFFFENSGTGVWKYAKKHTKNNGSKVGQKMLPLLKIEFKT